MYAEKLCCEGTLNTLQAENTRNQYMDYLNTELIEAASYIPEPSYFQRQWSSMQSAPEAITYWDTGLDYSLLSYIGHQSVAYPQGFVRILFCLRVGDYYECECVTLIELPI